jgi:hypothetical protein
MSIESIATRWAQEAGKPAPRFLSDARSNVMRSHDGRDLYSYGSHFALARIMLDGNGERSWFLVNGDSYSVSTSRHQSETRAAIAGTGLPYMIVSFSAMHEAHIDLDSVKAVDIQADRYETTRHDIASEDELPDGRWARTDDDGMYYETRRHRLGESVFSATYARPSKRLSTRQDYAGRDYKHRNMIRETAFFLSAFDENESTPLYFLAQLPKGAKPATVAEAREVLKPAEVTAFQAGELNGTTVLRQGDVFAIPTDLTTDEVTHRYLKRSGVPIERMAYLLGVNHTATDVVDLGSGEVYARGILRHKPREGWRRPEHRMLRLGDQRTWYRLVRNTVPDGRSWSRGGSVD